ncbi:MAG: right-handed parallel beta-helix repeat-containing protein [Parachlamydiaceae bacterium]|nr:MAG: right-handed parallel beta-helix repeat-containing protein [Parachlamydiaceae bacterium]
MAGRKSTIVIGNKRTEKEKADFVCSGKQDQESINLAIQSLSPDGGRLLLLEGEYIIDSSVIPNLNNLEIVGQGINRTKIRVSKDFRGAIFQDQSASQDFPRKGLIIRNMSLDGTSMKKMAMSTKGNFCHSLKNAQFENLHIYNTAATGIGTDFLINSTIRNNIIENCGESTASTGSAGIGIGTGDDSEEPLIITGNHVRSCGLAGILLESQKSAEGKFLHHIVSNNVIRENKQWGILIRGSRRVIINSNMIVGNSKDGIALETYFSNPPKDILISNNIVQGNGFYGISVYSQNAKSIEILGNILSENQKGCFYSEMLKDELSYFANWKDVNNKITGDCHVTGKITLSGLPSRDPQNLGELWNDQGTIKISKG